MAFYPDQPPKRASEDATIRTTADENELLCVPPAKMDEMLLDALDALEQTRKLHESTPNPELKRQTKQILTSLQSALMQLAPLGVHSVGRLARVAL